MKTTNPPKPGFSLVQHGPSVIAEIRNASGTVIAYGSANVSHLGIVAAKQLATNRALAQL